MEFDEKRKKKEHTNHSNPCKEKTVIIYVCRAANMIDLDFFASVVRLGEISTSKSKNLKVF